MDTSYGTRDNPARWNTSNIRGCNKDWWWGILKRWHSREFIIVVSVIVWLPSCSSCHFKFSLAQEKASVILIELA